MPITCKIKLTKIAPINLPHAPNLNQPHINRIMFVYFQKLRPSQFFLQYNAIADGIAEAYDSLPANVRFCLRPMFYLALGLHLALLFSPLPQESKPAEPQPEPSPTPETVKIMRLPPPQKNAPTAAPKQPTPKTPAPTAAPRPQVPTAAPVLPKANPAQPSPAISPSVAEQKQSEQKPAESTASNSPDKPSTSSPDSPPPAAPPPPTLEEFFRKFPQYPGASAGSGEILRSEFDQSGYIYNVGEGVDGVGTKFEQLLAAAQFKVVPGTAAADFKVYSVTLGPITQYLHLIGGSGKTAMVILPNSYSLEQLKTAQTDEMDPDTTAFETITRQFGSEYGERLRSPDPGQLVQAGSFADLNRFDVRSMTAAAFLSPPAQSEIINYFAQKLGADGFAFSPAGSYGGGPSYQVTRGKLSRCVIFAPTNIPTGDGSAGTAVILSASCP
ncbi:hypothetical protein [Oscillatoria sp. FACHB-1406]|uniref:hypothetical protein n=1 Tax=Oscillatoria sp. FACHB-1406 TaxID=2692846 RepID=UPI001689F8C9|nr:hypothetical protein [Oscillatoria sp. FACHB-1406]MBD2578012.1 hypothetical protein [Oscillatoria sp. FACHB-1406]